VSLLPAADVDELRRRAARIRLHAARMVARHGQGYLGQALSAAEIFSALFARLEERDRFVLSPGHYVIALYASLVEWGRLPADALEDYGRDGSELEAISSERTPGVDVACGSLGQGLSAGVGLALSARLKGSPHQTYVFVSDGELQEGQVWEAAMFAAHQRLARVVAIVDCNNSQVDGAMDTVMRIEPIEEKWRAFGWSVLPVDGHDLEQLLGALDTARAGDERPTVILARTDITRGLSFLRGSRDAHFVKLPPELAAQAFEELAHAS
jgi:transketolase